MELNREQIEEILPHRSPFLLLDRVTACIPGRSARAVWHITGGEAFLRGHFPGHPIVPGVLILEALAQTAAVSVLTQEENRGRRVLLAGLRNARFLRQVLPGDTLTLSSEIKTVLGDLGTVRVQAESGGEACVTAELSYALEG